MRAGTRRRHGRGPMWCLCGPRQVRPSCSILYCDVTVLQTFSTGGEILIIIRESSNKSLLHQRWLQVMVIVLTPEVYFVASTRQQGVSITVSAEVADVPNASLLRQLQLFLWWCTSVPAFPKLMRACAHVFPQPTRWSRAAVSTSGRMKADVANMSCGQVLGMRSSCANQQVKDFFFSAPEPTRQTTHAENTQRPHRKTVLTTSRQKLPICIPTSIPAILPLSDSFPLGGVNNAAKIFLCFCCSSTDPLVSLHVLICRFHHALCDTGRSRSIYVAHYRSKTSLLHIKNEELQANAR